MNIQYEVKFCLIKSFHIQTKSVLLMHTGLKDHLLKVSAESIKYLISYVAFSRTDERQKVLKIVIFCNFKIWLVFISYAS